MKINEKLFRKSQSVFDMRRFKTPETMANVPEDVQMALDASFRPMQTMLEHTMGVYAEGTPAFVGYGTLIGLSQNGLVRAGVETRADEMTRKWGEFTSNGESDDTDKLKELENEAKRFKLSTLFNKASAYCGYFGGCLVFIDTGADQSELVNPLVLTKETIKQGGIKGFRLIEPFTVGAGYYNSTNPMADDYFKPSLWYVQGIPVHASRFLYFAENVLPTYIRPSYNFFGLPLAQKVLDAVSHYTSCRESSSRLLEKYSLTIFKTDMEQILSGGMDDTLRQRIQYFVQMRNNDGCAAIDKEAEDLVVMTTSLSGVTDLVRQAEEYVAAMFNEPVTKMWGLSPAGFSTGDSDLQNHYDNIASLQEKMFAEPMAKITKLLQLNLYGDVDEDITFTFSPLSEDDEAQAAATNKVQAEIDSIYIDAGVIRAEEARTRIINDADSGYNDLSEEIMPAPMELSPFDENEDTDVAEDANIDYSEDMYYLGDIDYLEDMGYLDDPETVEDDWKTIKGAKVDIDEDGTINMGMGGKYTGKKIGELKQASKEYREKQSGNKKFDTKISGKSEVPDWFVSKLPPEKANIYRNAHDVSINAETEKAVRISALGDRGYTEFWVPKSVVTKARENNKAFEKSFEQGRQKYDKLLKFAKENNIKGVREGMRKDTIIKKVNEAGLDYKW